MTFTPRADVTDEATGALGFDVGFPAGVDAADVTITEQQQAGYQIVPVNGQNATCQRLLNGDPVPSTNSGDGFSLTAVRQFAITCTVYNRLVVAAPPPPVEPPPPPPVPQAAGPTLANTGVPVAAALGASVAMLVIGVGLVLITRRRSGHAADRG